jgi:NDP-sugar pyrophosphorylase family protein
MQAAGIIAAGLGSRLTSAAKDTPKPLVEVGGKPLVHWVASGLQAAGIREIVLLHNSRGDAVRPYLKEAFPDLNWVFLKADTASSWESFRLVSRTVAGRAQEFLMSTVDALAAPQDWKRFAAEALPPGTDAAMALTEFVDDEKPLWADIDERDRIRALGDDAIIKSRVTAGLYALTRATAEAMPPAATFSRLRDFWKSLILDGRTVRGVTLADTVDVDRPEDLPAAEKVLSCFEH